MMASGKTVAPYTHVVTVALISEILSAYGYTENVGGDISPKELTLGSYVKTVTLLGQSPSVLALSVDSNIKNSETVYVGRADLRKFIGSFSNMENSSGWSGGFTELLFTAEDVGKEIPIWLSTTPPPY